jgi:hypothetical protein
MMLAPSMITGCRPVHKCEGPRLINEAPHTLPKGESSSRRTPKVWSTLSKSRAVDHRAGSQEYPVWQAVLPVELGLTP